jgi:hypothetical protein
MSRIVTRGLGDNQLLATRGYGRTVVVIPIPVPPGADAARYGVADGKFYDIKPIMLRRDVRGYWASLLPPTVLDIVGGTQHDVSTTADIYGRIVEYIEKLYDLWAVPQYDVKIETTIISNIYHEVEKALNISGGISALDIKIHDLEGIPIEDGVIEEREITIKIEGSPQLETVKEFIIKGKKDIRAILDELLFGSSA